MRPFPAPRRRVLPAKDRKQRRRRVRRPALPGYLLGRCSRPRETQKTGKPWEKFVVPSSGSTYQRYSRSRATRVPSSPKMPCCGKMRAQFADNELLRRPIGFGDNVDVALVFRSRRLVRNTLEAALQPGGRSPPQLFANPRSSSSGTLLNGYSHLPRCACGAGCLRGARVREWC